MNWPFWSLSRPVQSSSCESIEPLLSLYADGMTSPDEARRVESHLPACDHCRESLAWMQATNRALAARPIAVPPAGLQSRIAEAIAASSSAPIFLRPARSFNLRPVYAAAASLTALGLVLSYSLWHTSPESQVKHTLKPSQVASVSVSKLPAKVGVIKHPVRHVSRTAQQPLVASSFPRVVKFSTVKHLPELRQTELDDTPIPQERIAKADVVPAVLIPHAPHTVVKAVVHRLPTTTQIASRPMPHAETRQPAVLKQNQNPEPAQLAGRPQPIVPVTILPSTVTTAPPAVQTASISTSSSAKLSDILGPVRTHIGQMHTVALLTTRQSYRGAATVMHTLDTEHTAYMDAIHSP